LASRNFLNGNDAGKSFVASLCHEPVAQQREVFDIEHRGPPGALLHSADAELQ
jgi:hypothetical protein